MSTWHKVDSAKEREPRFRKCFTVDVGHDNDLQVKEIIQCRILVSTYIYVLRNISCNCVEMTWQGQYWKQDEILSHMKLDPKLKMVLTAQNKSWYGEVYVVYPLIEYLFKIVNNRFEWRQRITALPIIS